MNSPVLDALCLAHHPRIRDGYKYLILADGLDLYVQIVENQRHVEEKISQ